MLKFAFELIDRASGPANRIAAGLDKISKGLAKADEASPKKLEKNLARLRGTLDKAGFGVRVAFGDKAADMLDRFTKGELKAADKAEIVRAGMGAAGKGLGLVAGAAMATTTALLAVGAAAVGAGAAGARMLLDAQKFKETTSYALKFTLGSSKAAADTLGDINRIANLMGTSAQEAAGKFRELNAAGFSDRESKILLQFAADLKAVNGGQEVAIAAISEPLAALKRNEVLTADSFKALEAAGMSRATVYKTLAGQLGVKIKDPLDTNKIQRDVDRALAQRQLRGQKAVDFWGKVTLAGMGEGKLGEKAKEFQDSTITGALDKVKNKWDALVASVASGPLAERALAVINRIASALDPATESGQGIVTIFNRIIAAAGKVWDVIAPLAEAFGEGFGEGFASAMDDVLFVFNQLMASGSNSQAFAQGLRVIGSALGELVVGVVTLVGTLAWLSGAFIEAVVTLPGKMRAAAGQAIDGFIEGLKAKLPNLKGVVTALANALPDGLRDALKIESPSKVMMQLGAYSGEGFAIGVERSAPEVQSAAQGGLVTPVVRATVAAPKAARSGGSIGSITINVSGSNAAESAAAIREELQRLLAEVGLEVGAAPA